MPEMSITSDKFVEPRRRELSQSPSVDVPTPQADAHTSPSIAGDPAFPSAEANDVLPSYENATLPRPSDAHVHVSVIPSESASSLQPIAVTGININTQGYLATAPMTSRHAAHEGHHSYKTSCWMKHCGDGCCFSSRGGCCFSDRGGVCCSDRGGFCCSDGGWFCSRQEK
ncbi:hypothetical protein ACQKWADRAFT_295317 [Trichoderma austrokoningii]